MCGLAGLLCPGGGRLDKLQRDLAKMTTAIAYRGPDDCGFWCDAEAGIALGHRRLAIIDLSSEGAQPMQSASGRYSIVFNGEIYNYRDLRAQLQSEGARFRSQSDTEVLLAGFEYWGVDATLRAANGMFALALWDADERSLILARDRFGQKPLLYGWLGGTFLFASELNALAAHPSFAATLEPVAVSLLLRYGNIPAPWTIHRDWHKLPPGCVLRLSTDMQPGQLPTPVAYWSATDSALAGLTDPFRGSRAQAAEQLDALLRDAVRLCMVSDVPIGAFLSGGIDSSTVVAIMQALGGPPVKSFSIGFREPALDEALYAHAVAQHLGTDHTELYVEETDALAVVPQLGRFYDEPFADSSQIPTYLVSRLARQSVTVCLSGDAGDELFGGYDRYALAARLAGVAAMLPKPLLSLGCGLLQALPAAMLNRLSPFIGDKLHRLGDALSPGDVAGIYARLLRQSPLSVAGIGGDLRERPEDWLRLDDARQMMMLLDTVTYLPDDILVKLDRASMAVSLESRVPLLDHRLYEFAWRLPRDFKYGDGGGKLILRDVLHKYLPGHLIERPKKGFGVPLDRWLRGPLRDWAESLLTPQALGASGLLDGLPIRRLWEEHRDGRRRLPHALWCVLMFQAWCTARR
ncbi:asparagine synthase (glutamine-hydrolyzing) [Ferrovibrio sp.]|uniref:asparagine synthase (glutamine-hydrolyzing) n=1 Tax=Ferrovibrio sp. TaxID=1917215 RepID=UPI003D10400F